MVVDAHQRGIETRVNWLLALRGLDTLVVLSLIHISEPTRPLYISYAVFCLKKKKYNQTLTHIHSLASYYYMD